MKNEKDISRLLAATKLAADRHRNQRRKDADGSPYINHPIDLAEKLWNAGGVRDMNVITAAILHEVVNGLRGCNEQLEKLYDEMMSKARSRLENEKEQCSAGAE